MTVIYFLLISLLVISCAFLLKENRRLFKENNGIKDEMFLMENKLRIRFSDEVVSNQSIIQHKNQLITQLTKDKYDLERQFEVYRNRESAQARNRAKPEESSRKSARNSTSNKVKGKSSKKR